MNSSQDPTNEAHQRVLSPLRGHWQDCLAVTNILLIPSLALNRLILRLKSSLINEPVNSETQVPVFSWETGLQVLCRFCSQQRRHSQTFESFMRVQWVLFLVHMEARQPTLTIAETIFMYRCCRLPSKLKMLIAFSVPASWLWLNLDVWHIGWWQEKCMDQPHSLPDSRWGGLCLKPFFFCTQN